MNVNCSTRSLLRGDETSTLLQVMAVDDVIAVYRTVSLEV